MTPAHLQWQRNPNPPHKLKASVLGGTQRSPMLLKCPQGPLLGQQPPTAPNGRSFLCSAVPFHQEEEAGSSSGLHCLHRGKTGPGPAGRGAPRVSSPSSTLQLLLLEFGWLWGCFLVTNESSKSTSPCGAVNAILGDPKRHPPVPAGLKLPPSLAAYGAFETLEYPTTDLVPVSCGQPPLLAPGRFGKTSSSSGASTQGAAPVGSWGLAQDENIQTWGFTRTANPNCALEALLRGKGDRLGG